MTSIFEQHIISSGRHYSYFAGRDNEYKMKPTNHVRWGVEQPQGMASPMLPTWVSWLSVLHGHNLSSLFKVGIMGLDRHCSDWRSSRMAFELVPWSRKHQMIRVKKVSLTIPRVLERLSQICHEQASEQTTNPQLPKPMVYRLRAHFTF